jgi:hypothetical protein
MGQRDIRRLLVIGAMAVVSWAARNGAAEGSWLARMLARKPRMCSHRARQQDGAVRLGHADEAGELPGPGGGSGLIGRTTSVRRGCEEVREQQGQMIDQIGIGKTSWIHRAASSQI